MPIAPVTVFDSFYRTSVNSWGVSDSGHDWQGEDSYFDVTTSGATLYVPASTGSNHTYISTAANASQEVLVRVKHNTNNTTRYGPMVRRSSGNTFYYAWIDADDRFKIAGFANGTEFTLSSIVHAFSSNTYYWVRLRADSTTVYAKVWTDGNAEPGSWSTSADLYSGSNAPGAGSFGFFAYGTDSTYQVTIDTLYWYTLEDDEPSLPVTDTFTRGVDDGFGRADTGHVWEGNFADDPNYYALQREGSVNASGYATITTTNDGTSRIGAIGPIVADSEATVSVEIDSATNTPEAMVGVRGAIQASSGLQQFTGYYGRIQYGSTTLDLRKVTTMGAASSLVGSFTLAAAPVAGEKWWIRVDASGTTVRAKAWKDGTSEPAYQISATDTSLTSGRAFLRIVGDAAATHVFKFYDFTHTLITSATALTVGALTTNTVTDSSFGIQATYTNDSDNDSSCTLQYRVQGADSWSSVTVTKDSVSSPKKFTGTASGLTQGTTYEVKATYTDADGVSGTNPLTTTVVTLLTGVDTGDLTFAVTDTTIDVTAKYTNDSDDDSTATVDYRSLGITTVAVNDTFTDIAALDLASHTSDNGTTWVRHPTLANVLRIDTDGTLYTTTAAAGHLYYASPTPASADYDVEAVLTVTSLPDASGAGAEWAGVSLRIDTTANTHYNVVLTPKVGGGGTWLLRKCVSGTFTVLQSTDVTFAVGDTHTVRLSARGTTVSAIVDGAVILSATDSAISAAGRAGVYMHGVPASGRGIVLDNFKVYTYSASGSYTGAVAMTADRPNKKFTKQITTLTADTTYEIKVTFTDSDGVRGVNPLVETITTLGKGVQISSLSATTTEISAVITLTYLYDTNENSTCAFQYRAVHEALYTTVNPSAVTTTRGSKTFRTTISGLLSGVSYEVLATVADADGVVAGASSTASAIFTTKGTIDPQLRFKHYVYKVYNEDDAFVGTWPDAPEPRFSYHENGGCTDMMVTLPRSLASLNADVTIDFGHRVDVIAIDRRYDGMGKNLILDNDMSLGSWTLTTSWAVDTTGGPDGTSSLKFSSAATTVRQVVSENVTQTRIVPLVAKIVAKARGGKLRMDMAAYDSGNALIEASTDNAETVGSSWQILKLEWTPPPTTSYVRVRVENVGAGNMWFDKAELRVKELLIYRGRIESYTPRVRRDGEDVEIEILGLVSQLSDDYIRFAQWVTFQPTRDVNAGRIKFSPTDPSNMLKKFIDDAIASNPRCDLYYTSSSIKSTGTIVEYTFRDQQLFNAFDKVRNLCPPGWHWFIEPDGLVNLRGPQHVVTHNLRLNVEIAEFENEKSIRNLKNYIVVKGRQDEDVTEPDGRGNIDFIAFDQASIDRYGKRVMLLRDANIVDPDTAELVGDGRLEEHNVVEQRGRALIPDEKDAIFAGGVLRGYNIESFAPGDFVKVSDPISGGQHTYWDRFLWDTQGWDSYTNRVLPDSVPIKVISYFGDHAELELSERQPSSTGAFARMSRAFSAREAETQD